MHARVCVRAHARTYIHIYTVEGKSKIERERVKTVRIFNKLYPSVEKRI